MNLDQFQAVMPLADHALWFDALDSAMLEFEINTPQREAMFIANIAAESNQLQSLCENLNYSAEGLARTWPNRYANEDATPNALAHSLARNPEAIANNVYAGRMGNGNETSGDGWRYRGAGPLQCTGRTNQLAAAVYFSIPFDQISAWLQTPAGGARSAARMWRDSGCNTYADKDDFDGVCDMINIGRKTQRVGDSIGYTTRWNFYIVARKAY